MLCTSFLEGKVVSPPDVQLLCELGVHGTPPPHRSVDTKMEDVVGVTTWWELLKGEVSVVDSLYTWCIQVLYLSYNVLYMFVFSLFFNVKKTVGKKHLHAHTSPMF